MIVEEQLEKEEEMLRKALKQDKPHHTMKESLEDGGESDQEEDQHSISDCPPSSRK